MTDSNNPQTPGSGSFGVSPRIRVDTKLLGLDKLRAGAGVIGLVGALGLFLVAIFLLITENFFLSLFFISLALMVYETGLDLVKILVSSFTIFFSSRHLMAKADYLQATLASLEKTFHIKRNLKGEMEVGPIPEEAVIKLPNNSLVRDLIEVTHAKKGYLYAEYVAHSYYVECHELYNYSNANLQFVSNAMPLFGLIGTVLGLIGMFDSLSANVTVEALTPQLALALKTTLYGALFSSIYGIMGTRFEQRLKALEYDFDTFCRVLEVLINNNNKIEVIY